MSDYISREAANEACREAVRRYPNSFYNGIEAARDAIRKLPAADVVKVVRCSECKYSEHWYRDKRLCRLWYGEEKPPAPIDVFDDGFCNYGERREDDG